MVEVQYNAIKVHHYQDLSSLWGIFIAALLKISSLVALCRDLPMLGGGKVPSYKSRWNKHLLVDVFHSNYISFHGLPSEVEDLYAGCFPKICTVFGAQKY